MRPAQPAQPAQAAAQRARARGLARLRGRIIPTPKNAPVRDLYPRHGFRPLGAEVPQGARQEAAREADGATDVETEWELELFADGIADPAWLTVVRRG